MNANPFRPRFIAALGLLVAAGFTTSVAQDVEPGFRSLFNGKDLTGWEGRPQHWSVKDGAITGITTKDTPAQGNNFLIARDGDKDLVVADFELRFSYKFTGPWGNSGLQYRSVRRDNFVVHGYQGDFEVGTSYSGILYEEGGRGILAQRGQKVVIKDADGKPKIDVTGSVGVSEKIQAGIRTNGWNDYVIIANGNHLQHFINGLQTVDVVDEQESKAAKAGILALQIHQGPEMQIQFKNIRIKQLGAGAAAAGGDLESIQGEWSAQELIANGNKVGGDAAAGITLTIKGNSYSVEMPNFTDNGKLKLGEGSSPKTMDITTANGDEIPAIYEVTKDGFKVCYGINGAGRPKEFKSEDGSNHILATYQRKKK